MEKTLENISTDIHLKLQMPVKIVKRLVKSLKCQILNRRITNNFLQAGILALNM